MPIKQYISYQLTEPNPDKQEILVAMLQDYGFDGFEQTDTALIANGYKETLNESDVEGYLNSNNIPYLKTILEEENWNRMWESDFPPIVIDHFCAVRAGFHETIKNVPYEIIIDPKMSFGTGHHATTWMMMKAMESLDFADKAVIDFGTGTGLLAILAEKMGAKTVDAIDYDDWCIENGKENINANHCNRINIMKAENVEVSVPANIILANINKNIILANTASLTNQLLPGGILLVSGILTADEADIAAAAHICGLKMFNKLEKNGWLCLQFTHAA